ncbi:MAG: hypothetical protein JO112_11940, partial [Planctomycetes bacterium]|nr:hypothetical protein [Planctomycetota bacterium]
MEILSATRYLFHGQPRDATLNRPAAQERPLGWQPPLAVGEGTAAAAEPELVPGLVDDLYLRLYVRAPDTGSAPADLPGRRDFLAALSAANHGRGSWDPGWVLQTVAEDGRVAVRKDGLIVWTTPEGLRLGAGALQAGASCRVRVAKELRGWQPGYYWAIGDADQDDPPGPLLRLYWHLIPQAAVAYMATVTSTLNTRGIPFRTKVLSDAGRYVRADAGVLYLGRSSFAHVRDALQEMYSLLAADLRPEVPLLTKPLAPGLGLAEDPRHALSFGYHRCSLIAQALWRSFQQGDRNREARMATLAAAFRETGRDPAAPFLEPGSRDIYFFRSKRRGLKDPAGRASTPKIWTRKSDGGLIPPPSTPSSELFLEAAIRIGRALCQGAYWDAEGRCCNWMGRSSGEVIQPGGLVVPAAAALGPDLYSGSLGVGLFLAQLWQLTGDADARQTALGAVARSFPQFRRVSSEAVFPLSYYRGLVGLAYATYRIGLLTGEGALDEEVDALLETIGAAVASPHLLDVIGGTAGAIPALLALRRVPRWGHLLELSVALGEELCRTAVRKGQV